MRGYKCCNECCDVMIVEGKEKPKYAFSDREKSGVFFYCEPTESVLLVQSNSNMWGPPKGTVEEGESYMDCAIREVKEETGISLSIEELSVSFVIPNQAIYYYYECDTNRPVCINNDEDANGYCWIKLECLNELIKNGNMVLTSHCRALFKEFFGITFPMAQFVLVKKKR